MSAVSAPAAQPVLSYAQLRTAELAQRRLDAVRAQGSVALLRH